MHMRRALELATKGLGRTRPNPAVGCVILDKSGVVVGEGFHPRAGEPHAEVGYTAEGERERGPPEGGFPFLFISFISFLFSLFICFFLLSFETVFCSAKRYYIGDIYFKS